MTIQINRDYRLLIGDYKTGNGIEITDLQVTFEVSKSADNSENSNSASIEIYNLSDKHLKILQTDYPAMVFEVGFNGNLKRLFAGQVINVTTKRNGDNRVTQLLGGTGYTELNHETIARTFPAGSTIRDMCQGIVDSFPSLNRGAFSGTNLNNPVIKGYPLSGTRRECLDKLSSTFRLEWRIDDDVLYINEKGRPENENFNKYFDISPSSGLLEIPYYESGKASLQQDDPAKKQGVIFKMLINAEVYPSQIIKLSDTDINGWYKVDSVRYSGSYRSGNWTQDVRCSAIEKVEKNQ